ncbi:hypothetical protein EVAR_20243_1 [Eumeta japonica]|uniref:Uncharacterized protein n=1 Tax=Eumeta variegata TaxID=151549 RepID=A0A4C1W9N5_EUMVA|nr:hypothetical protein EVAR_20243_1 [Eumeta japonica]
MIETSLLPWLRSRGRKLSMYSFIFSANFLPVNPNLVPALNPDPDSDPEIGHAVDPNPGPKIDYDPGSFLNCSRGTANGHSFDLQANGPIVRIKIKHTLYGLGAV